MKKKLIVAGTALGIVLLTGVTVFAVKKSNEERVKVISMQEMMGWGGGMSQSLSGNITSDVSQDIYVGMNQVVDEIFVSEGDTVSVGDKLVSYDMTLANLELEMKKLDREGIELNIRKAQREIKKLRNTKPMEENPGGGGEPGFIGPGLPEPPFEEPEEEPTAALEQLDETSMPYMGQGTEENPYHFLCSQKGVILGSFLNKRAEDKSFFVIEVRESDLSNGALMKIWGQKITEENFQTDPEKRYVLELGEYSEEEEIKNPMATAKLTGEDVEKERWCKGDGSVERPYIFLVTPDGVVEGSFFNRMKELGGYFRLEVREEDNYSGILLKAWEQDAKNLEEIEEILDETEYLVGLEVKEKEFEPSDPTDSTDPETPSPEPTGEPTPSPTGTPEPTDTPTPEPTATPVPTETPTPEPTASPEPTAEPTGTPEVPTDPAVSSGEGSDIVNSMAYSKNQVKVIRTAALDSIMGGGGSYMSKEEIQRQIKAKEQEIRGYQLDLKEKDLELKKLEKALNNQTIKSTLNGVIKSVGDPEKDAGSGKPLIQVVSSEGLYISGMISELQLDTLKVGQMLNGYSYDTGVSFIAEVREISPYPAEGGYYGYGNGNASMYPFTAYIENAEGLNNYSYAELTIANEDGSAPTAGVTIEKPFVRTEDGQYYVMIDDGNGKLKKQVVEIARVVYGSTYEISSGLTWKDKIAFPYGKNVKEGAKTEDGTFEDLYR